MSEKKNPEYRKNLPQWVSIGFVSGAHGIKGELKVVPLTDDPQRFRLLENISLVFRANTLREFTVLGVRFQKKYVLLRLNGIDDRTAAEQLKGFELKIPRKLCMELPEDRYYHFQLIGLSVHSTSGDYLGKVSDVMDMPANDVYVVHDAEKEILVPAIKDVVKKIDLEQGVMTIELIEGLVD